MTRKNEIKVATTLMFLGMAIDFLIWAANRTGFFEAAGAMLEHGIVIIVVSLLFSKLLHQRLPTIIASMLASELIFQQIVFWDVAASRDAAEFLYIIPIYVFFVTTPIIVLGSFGMAWLFCVRIKDEEQNSKVEAPK